MKLYYIRHAQSQNNALIDLTGSSSGRSSDPELTHTGRQQAALLARCLVSGNPDGSHGEGPGFGLTHLYTSLMTRAVATGWEIANATGLPLEGLADVFEEGGIYLGDPDTGQPLSQSGPGRDYFQANFPGIVLPADFIDTGWWNDRPFETPQLAAQRAAGFLRGLVEKHGRSDDRVALISHGNFFNHLMAAVNRRSSPDSHWYVLNNASISRFDITNGGIGIVYLNRTAHLPARLLS